MTSTLGPKRLEGLGAAARQASRTACGKRSDSGQAETACPIGDYSKKHSLVERKSTAQLTQPYLNRALKNIFHFIFITPCLLNT
ncbi:hypothetical protein E2R56_21700 [Rhodococcus qingshengii]|nr:hypothetical protein E2R56_21700 [Rhodococcus qingshengii]